MAVRVGVAVAVLILTVLTWPMPDLQAQGPRMAPLAPPGHWALDAARRLHAAGLLPRGYDPVVEPAMLSELLAAFDAARERSDLARAYHARLSEELNGLVLDADSVEEPYATHGLVRVQVGVRSASGQRQVGAGYDDTWSGPLPRRSPSGAVAGAELLGRTREFGAALRVTVGEEGLELGASHLVAGVGPVAIWAGNGGLRFPTSAYGGVVLSQVRSRPGLGVQFLRPVSLPVIGFFRFSSSLTRTEWNQPLDHPWLWASRLFMSPHPRLNVAINRGVMFGGGGNSGFSLRKLGYMLVGKHSDGYDNQVVSLSGRYRPPVGIPLELHGEWGLEDSAGAWKDVPGILVGAELAALPGLPEVAVGLSAVHFKASCCGNSIWYQNFAFRGGWADDGFLLGHSLGGNGTEARAYARADLFDARVLLRSSVFGRDRGPENLFAPEREGRSIGLTLGVTGLIDADWQVEVEAAAETGQAGTDWRETRIDLGIRGTL